MHFQFSLVNFSLTFTYAALFQAQNFTTQTIMYGHINPGTSLISVKNIKRKAHDLFASSSIASSKQGGPSEKFRFIISHCRCASQTTFISNDLTLIFCDLFR